MLLGAMKVKEGSGSEGSRLKVIPSMTISEDPVTSTGGLSRSSAVWVLRGGTRHTRGGTDHGWVLWLDVSQERG